MYAYKKIDNCKRLNYNESEEVYKEEIMKKDTIEQTEQELKDTRRRLIQTFGEMGLRNLEMAESDLEKFKKAYKDEPQEVYDYELDKAKIRTKINIILKEQNLMMGVDEALDFLDRMKRNALEQSKADEPKTVD